MMYFISRTIFEILIRLLFKLRIYRTADFPKPPFIIASNHCSLLDPPLVGIACRRHLVNFMAKKELFDIPVIGVWSRLVSCIEVKRGKNSVGSLKEAIKRLHDGKVVGVFPEGTRSVDGNLQDAKRGTGFLISKSGVPVVPVYIEGSGKALSKGGGIRYGAAIRVFTGKFIMPEELLVKTNSGKIDYAAVSRMVMERVACLGK